MYATQCLNIIYVAISLHSFDNFSSFQNEIVGPSYKVHPLESKHLYLHCTHASSNYTLTLFVNGCIYRWVDAWKVLTDVLWVTEIHNSSVFVVTEKKGCKQCLAEFMAREHLVAFESRDTTFACGFATSMFFLFAWYKNKVIYLVIPLDAANTLLAVT